MQDPSADTQWNDVLRKHGILPNKESNITEEQLISLTNETIENYIGNKDQSQQAENYTLQQLDEAEDELDENLLDRIRKKRIDELRQLQLKKKYGSVIEITAASYVDEVNKAGDNVWVVLYLHQNHLEVCKMITHALADLARKFPEIKFVSSVATECIKDYPDKNVPTIFIHKNSSLVHSFVGPHHFSGLTDKKTACDYLEWMLAGMKVLKSKITKNPLQATKFRKTQISSSIFGATARNNSSDNDDDMDYSD